MPELTKKIVQLQDVDDQEQVTGLFYPTTLGSAVVMQSGDNLEQKMAAIDADLAKLLYVAPAVKISATQGAGYYELGTTVHLTVNADVTAHSKDITKLAILKNSAEVATDTSKKTSLSFSDDISANATYKATATDGDKSATSSQLTYTFVNPVYWGVADATKDTLTEADILEFTNVSGGKVVAAKASKASQYSHTFNLNNQKMVIATPSVSPAWEVTKIYDPNGFDITSSFTKTTVTVKGVAYNVYMSNPTSQTGFVVKFY